MAGITEERGGITDIPGIRVGHIHNVEALTGCTVVLCEQGAVGGVDVRGGAPGTRETDLLHPYNLVQHVHAVLLAGGSAFGLDAAAGVMRYLENRDSGFDTGVVRVPIVPAAALFDLAIGDAYVRPDAEMGYAACLAARSGPVEEGNVGAGCGASVGKMMGMEYAVKGGLGTASRRFADGLIVGAIVAVNAWGSVVDYRTRTVLAGPRHPQTGLPQDTVELLKTGLSTPSQPFRNTTIGVVATNARLDKAQMGKIATLAQNGLARTIHPVHTLYDGDTIFSLSTGTVDADETLVGALAADVLAEAVLRGVWRATAAGGLPACSDLVTLAAFGGTS